MSEGASSRPSPRAGQEFIIRAPGSAHLGVDYFLGKFPKNFSDFKSRKSGWLVRSQTEEPSASRRGPVPKKPRILPLALEDKPGHTAYVGQPEGGFSGSGVGLTYFILAKEGAHFTAMPVKDWYNFRPVTRTQALSLDEAEKQMSSRGANARLTAGSKLGALLAKAEAEGEEPQDGDQEGEQPDSDEEREHHRAARVRAANTEAAKGATPENEDDMPSAQVHTDQQEKGEDWEHEEERQDDDLGQGDEEGSDTEAPATEKKQRAATSDGDSEGEAQGLSEAQQELRRVLRKTHLSSGSEDGGSSLAGDDEEDDDLDLDEMASDLLPKSKPAPESGARARARNAAAAKQAPVRGGEKRKAMTPPVNPDRKKVKAATPEAKAEIKQEGGPESSNAAAEAVTGPPGPQEILAALKSWGLVTTGELTARFRKRIATQQDKQAFMASVKKVSKLEERPPGSGKKFVVPR